MKKNVKTFENLDKSKCVPNSIVTETPSLHNISSPGVPMVEYREPILKEIPLLQDVKTPVRTAWDYADDCDESKLYQNKDLSNTHLFQKYISNEFCNKEYISYQEVSLVLKKIRIENINRVIISHLNVNFFAVKLDSIRTISGNMDIMVFTETKIDASYPTSQLKIDGFKKPYRLDRNAFGGGILIYVRQDIPSKQLKRHKFADNIEGIFVEINFYKSKWLLFGTYHPPSQNKNFYFENVGRALDL